MIKKIIHTADIHIRNYKRHEEYREILTKFLEECKDIASEYRFDEVRIVIVGDIVHQKIQTSNELSIILAWLLRELDKIAPTIIIAGNHDFLENNKDRIDTLTPIITLLELKNVTYLDMISGYKSFCYKDDNIIWCLYSIFDNYKIPDVKLAKIDNPDKSFIGLFHGALIGASTDTGLLFEHGISLDIFNGCDAVLCGDIHKRMELDYNGTKVVYCSSLIQQNFGENKSKHGYLVWDIDTLEYEEHDIETEYGFYKFKISSVDDIENGTEEFVNF